MMQTRSLTYTLTGPGPSRCACHASGHYEAGMSGTIAIRYGTPSSVRGAPQVRHGGSSTLTTSEYWGGVSRATPLPPRDAPMMPASHDPHAGQGLSADEAHEGHAEASQPTPAADPGPGHGGHGGHGAGPSGAGHDSRANHAEHADHDRHAGHSVAMFRDKFWLSLRADDPGRRSGAATSRSGSATRRRRFPGSELHPGRPRDGRLPLRRPRLPPRGARRARATGSPG